MPSYYHNRDKRRDSYEPFPGEDASGQGALFTKRGPQGYRRPDARVREEINERLARQREIDASRIQVSVDDGEVTLSGRVGALEERRLAEAMAKTCFGVKEVRNKLRVTQTEAA